MSEAISWEEAQENATEHYSVVVDESNDVWEGLLQQGCASLTAKVTASGSALPLPVPSSASEMTLRWLKGCLPHSLPYYNQLYRLEKHISYNQDTLEVFVNSFVDPSAILFWDNRRKEMPELCVFGLATDAVTALLRGAVMAKGGLEGAERLMFSKLDSTIHEAAIIKLVAELAPDLSLQRSIRCDVLAMWPEASVAGKDGALSSGAEISKVKMEDAEEVNDHWPLKREGSVNFAKRLIAASEGASPNVSHTHTLVSGKLPNAAIRLDGKLVAWCLTYDDGALAQLYTHESYRRRGFSSACISEMIRQYKEIMPLKVPFCYIIQDNEASHALFEGSGFTRIMPGDWIIFGGSNFESR